MKILGVDPGTINTGWGMVRYEDGSFISWDAGVCHAPGGWSRPRRLLYILERLTGEVGRLKPDVVAMETPFIGRNPQTGIAVGQGQALAMLAAEKHGVTIAYYTPGEVKKAATSYGGSGKTAVAKMVSLILGGIKEPLGDDATDALAVAICHANRTDEAALLMGAR